MSMKDNIEKILLSILTLQTYNDEERSRNNATIFPKSKHQYIVSCA